MGPRPMGPDSYEDPNAITLPMGYSPEVRPEVAVSQVRSSMVPPVIQTHGASMLGHHPSAAAADPSAPLTERLRPLHLGETGEKLLNASLAQSTNTSYTRNWLLFTQFLADLGLQPCVEAICHYIEYMYDLGYKHSSISSHLSAIAYALKLRGIVDFTQTFLVKKLLSGAKNLTPSLDSRLPVTEHILKSIIHSLFWTLESRYEKALFAAIFSWAFHACLRASEYTDGNLTDHNLNMVNITRTYNDGNPGYRIRFSPYKFCNEYSPDLILKPAIDHEVCPILLMDRYLALRSDNAGPVFMLKSKPVSSKMVSDVLHSCLRFIHLPVDKFALHSFRIGRCLEWAKQGYSALQIRKMGRWNSTAFLKYIRLNEVVL